MDLSYACGRAGGTMTGVLSAANEQAVAEFLEEKISYLVCALLSKGARAGPRLTTALITPQDIIRLNEACCEAHKAQDWLASPGLDEIVHFDAWARKWVAQKVASGKFRKPMLVGV